MDISKAVTVAGAVLLVQSSWAAEKYVHFSTKPDRSVAVQRAPEYRYGWVRVDYPKNKYGTATLRSVKGPGVVALAPSFGSIFQVKLKKTAYRTMYCVKPPCYVGEGIVVAIDFKVNQQYTSAMRGYPFHQPIVIRCQATQTLGTPKSPFIHTITVYEIQRRMIFSCR